MGIDLSEILVQLTNTWISHEWKTEEYDMSPLFKQPTLLLVSSRLECVCLWISCPLWRPVEQRW